MIGETVSHQYDKVYPFQSRVLSLCNLLREPKQPATVEGGHVPPLDVRVPMINKSLDETLGPVRFK